VPSDRRTDMRAAWMEDQIFQSPRKVGE
jgi:hypothetical protein